MEKARITFVGLGQRGKGMLSTFLGIDYVDVVSLCDVYKDRVDEVSQIIKEKRNLTSKPYKVYGFTKGKYKTRINADVIKFN